VTTALYPCQITHVRTRPIQRVFRYGSYLWLVDVDELPWVPLALRPLAQFRARDHLGGASGAGASLRSAVDTYLASHGIDLAGGQVLMLGHARVLGHVFNPLTVFWCHRGDGSLAAIIAEVHNTYGQRHAYLLHPDRRGRAEAAKTSTSHRSSRSPGATGCICRSPATVCGSASPCTSTTGPC